MKTLLLNISRLFIATALIAAVIGITGAVSVAEAYSDDEKASCWISASPRSVYEGGSTTLTWGSHNADDAWISDIGDVGVYGSRIVYDLDENETFKLTVQNEQGTATCETDVKVKTYSYSTGSTKAPGCTIWRENMVGNGVTLRWNSTNASSAFLSNVGSVSAYGTYVVYPTYDTTYTLTVYGNGQSRTCEIEIDREYATHYPHNYTNYGNQYGYNNYSYPYISLTQIPYTGIDLGVVGTAVYFLALALFAISGGYLLSYYQGGVFRFSFAQEVKAAARNQARSLTRLFRN